MNIFLTIYWTSNTTCGRPLGIVNFPNRQFDGLLFTSNLLFNTGMAGVFTRLAGSLKSQFCLILIWKRVEEFGKKQLQSHWYQ